MSARDDTVGSFFRSIAERHADELAVSDGQRRLSYRELDALSDKMSGVLRRAANSPGPVALLLDHTAVGVAALLGATKAGLPYCFVPSNGTPSEQQAIVSDLQPAVILADAANLRRAEPLAASGAALVDVGETDGSEITRAVDAPADPFAPVAVYYTSGSTGTPKGVIRTHQSIIGRLEADIAAFRVGSGDNLAQLRPLHVGASSSILFNAILSGAALHLADPRVMNPGALAAWLLKCRITALTLPTPLMREMLQAIPPGLQFPDLRYCRLAGRALKADLRSLWPHLPGGCIVGHGLASTEAALMTHIGFRHGELPVSDILPVGKPVRGVQLWIVDDDDYPVPTGACGEIVVSSPCVMAGYWGKSRAAHRAAAPDSARDGCRVFHTGDVGRIDTDGMVEFLGRQAHPGSVFV